MNRRQRRVTHAQGKNKKKLRIHGKTHTLKEAGTLAAKELSLGNAQTAADIYNLILTQFPDHAESCNQYGITLHKMARYGDALTNYGKAITLRPDYAEAYSNQSITLQAMKQYTDALANCDKAISLKPDYAEAHYNRGVVLYGLNRYEDALASYDKAIALNPKYATAHLNRGLILYNLNRCNDALASYDRAIALKPEYAEAYLNRGVTLQKMRQHESALASYDKAITLRADYATAYYNRGNVLQEMKRYEDALASYDKAIALRPELASAYNNRGNTLQEVKRYDDALASYDKAIALDPVYAEAYQNRGVVLLNKGEIPEAEKMFLKALALKPDFPNCLLSLTSIRKYQDVDNADAKNIRTLLKNPGMGLPDKECLYFSLGKIYDDCSAYDEAFECYRQANAIRKAATPYNPEAVSVITRAFIEFFDKTFLEQPFAYASGSQSPLFIVGMPRSGTTLMANILSNHPSIGSAGELPTMNELILRMPELIGELIPYPYALKHITPAIASYLTNTYEARLRRDTGADIPHVIDKHPLNFRYLGFIAMLFPKARIIHCTRNPLDTGISNYFQRFSSHYSYSSDLKDIGHFYGEYARLMEHWKNVLPVKMIEIRYEDMVMHTEETARKTLGVLGLEWDERCLAPHTNPRVVETASRWQVRQPIYSGSVERWRHYEKHLAPLKEALQS